MKLSAFALAAVAAFAAFAASQAHAAGDFNVSCGQMHFFVGDTGHAEYVTSTDVSRNGIYWTVIHHMSSGKSYSRRVQYDASDISRSNFDEWGGVRVGHPNIVMHGLIGIRGDRVVYSEWVYDTNLPGKPGAIGKLVGNTDQDCGSASAPVPAPVEAAAPPRTSAAPGSLSTYLGM
jgi:hypothetical protein